MDRIFVYNFNFAIARENRSQLGNITINKDGELKLSPTIVKSLSTSELSELSQRAIRAYALLITGNADTPFFTFKIKKGVDRYTVIKKVFEKETCIGHILYNTKKLTFQNDTPEYIRNLCVEQLNDAHETDFYYRGAHYDGD